MPLLPVPAFAAEPTPLTPAPTAPSAAAPSAESLAARAYALHEAGRYAEAIATYLEAYKLSSAAVTLFNVATIYDRKLHESALAADYYRRYLAAPDAEPELVKKATARLTALKGEDVATPIAVPPPPPSPPSPLSPPVHAAALRPAGIAVTAVGVAATGAGLVLGLLAKCKNDDANGMCSGRVCSSEEGVMLAHQASTLATASTATFFAGLALAGGGVVMILLSPRHASQPSSHLAIAPFVGPYGAGLGARASF
ncbi:MAG TPA: hypothetical protein VH044_02085 [Polyangiaceae bacterium]|jgi:hypothetical protein|nr:hypothetical protein [Polyangiaceae bacterium]